MVMVRVVVGLGPRQSHEAWGVGGFMGVGVCVFSCVVWRVLLVRYVL